MGNSTYSRTANPRGVCAIVGTGADHDFFKKTGRSGKQVPINCSETRQGNDHQARNDIMSNNAQLEFAVQGSPRNEIPAAESATWPPRSLLTTHLALGLTGCFILMEAGKAHAGDRSAIPVSGAIHRLRADDRASLTRSRPPFQAPRTSVRSASRPPYHCDPGILL